MANSIYIAYYIVDNVPVAGSAVYKVDLAIFDEAHNLVADRMKVADQPAAGEISVDCKYTEYSHRRLGCLQK